MPSWKKVIVSGSDASFNSLYVLGGATSDGGFTGSLFGTASQAISASYATTASFALTASYAQNIIISGSISNVDYIDFDLTSSFAAAAGRLGYDSGEGTLQFGLAGGNVALNIGEDLYQYVYNATTSSLTKGQVVYISGSQGNRIAVKLASAVAEQGSANTLGFVAETIAAGDEGWVMTEGNLRGLNTLGLVGGQLIFLGTTPGTYTQTPPVAPDHGVRLGYAERINATVGSIFVKIDNGYELGELHNIIDSSTTSSYGDLLVKSGSVWINSKQLTGSYGVTGSINATSFTGSLFGTASYALTASYVELAQTASYVENAQTASYVLNAVSASYALSASYASGSDTSISASYALSASYATTASFASNLTDQGIVFCTTASTLWSAQHNLNTLTPIVNVYDSNNQQLIPASITSLNYNVTQIAFSTPVSGCAVISKGSGLSSVSALTASYALTASMVLDQGFQYSTPTPSTTWVITHNLNTLIPLVNVYNSSYYQIIPSEVVALDYNTIEVRFSIPTAGEAIVSRGSGLSSVAVASASFATTASYSVSASYAENVRTICYTALTSSATWAIPHNFGCKYVMVNVYDNNDDAIIPNRINLTDSNTTTIYFTVPTSGTALLIPANCCGTPTTTTSTTTTTTTATPTTTTSTTTSTTTAEPTTTTSTTTSTTTAESTTTTSTTTSTTTGTPTTTTSTTTSTTTAASYAYTLYSSTGYSNAGDACTNQPSDPTSTVYAAEFLIGSVTRFYSDSSLITPIVGGDQWWAFGDGVQIYRAQISNGGFLSSNASC